MTGLRCARSEPAAICRRLVVAVVCAVAAVPSVSTQGRAEDRIDRGRSLLSQNCATCHAIGKSGASPLRAAPTFRSIGNRVSLDELFDRLQEGLSSAHRDMPSFRFDREDAHAIRSYLGSIQE